MDYANDLLEIEEVELIDEMNIDDVDYNVRERQNHMNIWNDREFFHRFRMSKETKYVIRIN